MLAIQKLTLVKFMKTFRLSWRNRKDTIRSPRRMDNVTMQRNLVLSWEERKLNMNLRERL
jgi:hypothetical protein